MHYVAEEAVKSSRIAPFFQNLRQQIMLQKPQMKASAGLRTAPTRMTPAERVSVKAGVE